jgi:hypothetical protein
MNLEEFKWLENEDIIYRNWSDWKKLDLEYIDGKICDSDGKEKLGAYIIKTPIPYKGRIVGDESNVLYIGEGKLESRLWCLADLKNDWNHDAQELVRRYKNEYGVELEFTYAFTRTKENCKYLETQLLLAYLNKFLELPPFNRKGPRLE